MKDLDLYSYYTEAKDQHILVFFKGAVSQEILVEMGTFIKNKINFDKKIKKIFSVFVELAQNIMHYSSDREELQGKDVGVGIVLFTETKECYNIYSGNEVLNSSVNKIEENLRLINSLDKDGLKKMYSKQIRSDPSVGSKGAGLGFLDIARKSKNKILYEISSVDDNFSFLSISVKINKGE